MKIHLSQSEAHALDVLRANPGVTIEGLISKAGLSRSTVRNALLKAEASGNLLTNREWPRRYTYIDIPQADEGETRSHVVAPDVVKPAEFGKKFKGGKPAILKVLTATDPVKQDRNAVLDNLEVVSKAILGLYVALSQVEDGPEWRQQAGVE